MKRTAFKRISALLLIMVILMGLLENGALFAETPVLQPPQRNRITDIGYVQNINARNWYADLQWDAAVFPADADERYVTLGLNEIISGTGQMIQDAFKIPLPGGATAFDLTEYSPEGIRHGTIYEASVRSTYNKNTATGVVTVISQRSNPAKFLTGLHVTVELVPGTNNIKIKWDDVWDTNGRINYRILISDTKGFTQPPPVPDIIASEIGKAGSAVNVYREEKKLEYVYTHAMPGREYSIKVIPVPGPNVSCATAEEIGAITIKTDILLKAQKVGFTNEGDVIWKLFWNPIVKGNTFTRVDYELYRYTNESVEPQLFRLIPDIDSYQITVRKNDPNVYSFKIDAKAYVQGSPAPIEFRSNNRVMLKEQVPLQPQAPDIVDSFPNADPVPIRYDGLLTSTSASILWRVPYTGEGLVDNDVSYDIYLLEDLKDVPNPPSNARIASDFVPGEANQIRDRQTGAIIGYRYNLQGLKSNATYYFVIYAKKNFLVQSPDSGFMITMPYLSKQAVKVIITRPDAGSDRPVAPSAPPFGLMPGDDSVSYTSAVLMMQKRWYSLYDSDSKRWEYATPEEYTDNLLLDPADPNKRLGKLVDYLPGWTVVPHVVNYNDALNAIRMRNNRPDEYITYSDLSQPDIKAFEIAQGSMPIPDIGMDQDQTFSFNITGLTHNTAYLVWVTIENQNGTASDPSDPIVITTPPNIPEIPVTPTVPNDLKGIAADSFVDLFWTFSSGMDYRIKGGTEENPGAASITREVSHEDIQSHTFFRVDALEPDTVYYFWIKSLSAGTNGQVIESEYSNPLVIRTEAYRPPAPPSGFGVKSGADGVTEKSITYIWEAKSGFSYFLEFADNANFVASTTQEVSGNTFTMTGLSSNRRYYARLYAYENRTLLRSEPTRAVMVVTNKSKSEYDGSFDLDEAVSGDGLVVPSTLEGGVWTISSLGANGHVLGERIRSNFGSVVQIDLSHPPARTSTIRLDLSTVVVDVLSDLKKELYVRLPWGQLLLRPGTFQTDQYFREKGKDNNLSFRIEAVSPASQYKPSSDMQIKTPVTDLKLSYLGRSAIDGLARPIRVELPVQGLSAYSKGQLKAYSFDASRAWYALPTFIDYSQGLVAGELDGAGAVVAATSGVLPSPSVPYYIQESMAKIQSVFELKSIKNKIFNYSAPLSQKDILKLIMDVIPADYTDSNLIQRSLSAGLMKSAGEISDSLARRDKAVDLLVSLYRYKTRESTVPARPSVWSRYRDLLQTDSRYLEAYKFALENGIVQGNGSEYAYPSKTITYGEFLAMLERTLRLCGEL